MAVDSDSDTGVSSSSEDSATWRRRAAEERLRDYDEEVASPSLDLPNPLEVLGVQKGRPAFLDPEATRPLAAPVHRRPQPMAAMAPAEDMQKTGKRHFAAGSYDTAKSAPVLKGQAAVTQPGVIHATPKRYKIEDRVDAGEAVTAAQVAMLGGQWRPTADDDLQSPAGPAPPGGKAVAGKGRSTASMGVLDFLDKGGSASLPRKKQERKDKERSKRQLGQSAIGTWKTEAEMVLRQQYDS